MMVEITKQSYLSLFLKISYIIKKTKPATNVNLGKIKPTQNPMKPQIIRTERLMSSIRYPTKIPKRVPTIPPKKRSGGNIMPIKNPRIAQENSIIESVNHTEPIR